MAKKLIIVRSLGLGPTLRNTGPAGGVLREMTVALVTYEDAHLDGVRTLWQEVFPDDPPRNWAERSIPEKQRFQPGLIVVALDRGRVVGTVMAGYDGHRGALNTVAVLPAYRKQGIGAALIAEAEARLRQLGCIKINIQIRMSNAAVAEFYRKLGYVVEERISMGKVIAEGQGEEPPLREA